MSQFSLADLAAIIEERAGSAGAGSYTAELLAGGVPRAARKFGEEAIETIIAALAGDRAALTAEAADLAYHFLVLLKAAGVPLDDVMSELQRRTAQSGLTEKAARK